MARHREKLVTVLGQVLSRDFLDCTVGTIGLYFDPQQEEFVVEGNLALRGHLITTEIAFTRDYVA